MSDNPAYGVTTPTIPGTDRPYPSSATPYAPLSSD